MGQRADKVKADFGDQAKLYYYANLGITAACLIDYFLLQHRWALETLAVAVLAINSFALWQRRHDLNNALQRDLEDEAAATRSEAVRDASLRAKGLR